MIVFLFIYLTLLSGSYSAQNTQNFISDCCAAARDKPESQLDCLERYAQVSSHHEYFYKNANILFLSYYTHHIRDHALYSFGLNSFYSAQYDSSLHMLSPSTGHDHDRHDQRWNKVMIIEEYLLKILSSTNKSISDNLLPKYLVWIDADLVVIDQTLDFYRDLIIKYPHRDILISREINPVNGIANSGCFVVKVSTWSLLFFQTWWRIRDRTQGMDQHVFDYLYHNHETTHLDSQSHIELLEVDVINSQFPGLINYEDKQQVLHLAGESNFIRAFIFQHAWNSLCRRLSAHVDDKFDDSTKINRLDIDRHFLDNIDYIALHEAEWKSIHEHVVQTLDRFSQYQTSTWSQQVTEDIINQLRYRIREAQQSIHKFICHRPSMIDGTAIPSERKFIRNSYGNADNDDTCVDMQDLFHDKIVVVLRLIFKAIDNFFPVHEFCPESSIEDEVSLSGNTVKERSENCISGLQLVLDTGMELLLVEQDPYQFSSSVKILQKRVNALKRIVPNHLKKFVLYYEFKIQEFSALHHERAVLLPFETLLHSTNGFSTRSVIEDLVSEANKGMVERIHAYNIWKDMHEGYNFHGTGNGVLTNFQEVISLLKKIIWSANMKYFHNHLLLLMKGLPLSRDVSLCETYPKVIEEGMMERIIQDLVQYLEVDMQFRYDLNIHKHVDEGKFSSLLSIAKDGLIGITNDILVQLFDAFLLMSPFNSCKVAVDTNRCEIPRLYFHLFCSLVMFEESDNFSREQRTLWQEKCLPIKKSIHIDHHKMLSTTQLSPLMTCPDGDKNKCIDMMFSSFAQFTIFENSCSKESLDADSKNTSSASIKMLRKRQRKRS
jgi:hypothetical protein